ncbi:MAG: ATP-binding protein [Chloroflexi bacterium]|nr:ATP-binding protein [Chloroflexota bacterium]
MLEVLEICTHDDQVHRPLVALDDVIDALRRERRFVADASHELRTPLALLQTELELALRRPRSAEELGEALRSVTDEVERLARLADDLLLLATTDEGRVPVWREPIPLPELLGTVRRRFEARAAATGRALTVESRIDERIDGDRLRLEQALGNLLDNALRHGEGQVTLSAARDRDGTVALTVSDEGAGFPADFLPHALEGFSRADAARTRSGSGLGLAIVDAIVRAHGGSVRVGNIERGAAVVSIVVPGVER